MQNFLSQNRLLLAAGLLLALNALGFVLMCVDKARAVRKTGRRIPERTLLLLSVCFGSFGTLLGMLLLRHKTNAKRHPAFACCVPVLALVQGGLLIFLLLRTR